MRARRASRFCYMDLPRIEIEKRSKFAMSSLTMALRRHSSQAKGLIIRLKRTATILVMTSLVVAFLQTEASDNPFTLNGGSVMGMAGKNCVVLAVDKRFASGPQMVTVSPRRTLVVHSKLMVGFAGLDGDVQGIAEELSIQIRSKQNRERNGLAMLDDEDGCEIEDIVGGNNVHPRRCDHLYIIGDEQGKNSLGSGENRLPRNKWTFSAANLIRPRSLAMLTSHVMYSKRNSPFFCEPLIVGLEKQNERNDRNCDKANAHPVSGMSLNWIEKEVTYKPYLCGMDMLGAKMESHDFACSGAASKSMYGTAEAMWKPEMSPDELLQVCSRAFLSALERDCLSGYGAVVYLITPEKITEHELAFRTD